jgi:hypothetical protein
MTGGAIPAVVYPSSVFAFVLSLHRVRDSKFTVSFESCTRSNAMMTSKELGESSLIDAKAADGNRTEYMPKRAIR